MRYGYIAGERISKFILGTDVFSLKDSEHAFELMNCFVDRGGNAFDTARLYAEGQSEAVIGRWLAANPDSNVKIISKCSHPTQGMHISRLSKEEIDADVKTSLEYLPKIDFLLLHRDDRSVDVGGIMESLQAWIEDGRVKHIGASNWSVERIAQANAYAVSHGLTPFSVSEIAWSFAKITPKAWGDETLVCMNDDEGKIYRETGFPVLAYASQAKGFFTKLRNENIDSKVESRYRNDENVARAEKLWKLADEKGVSSTAACAAYVAGERLNGFAILGCKTVEHLKDSLSAADLVYTRDEFEMLCGDGF